MPQQAVRILVNSSLPGAVRVSEVDRRTGPLGDPSMMHQFAALVVSESLAHLQRYPTQRSTETLNGRCGGGTVHFSQEHQTTDTLHQGANS